MDYKIKLDEFEGPLDLLLHLIKKSNIDIYDISIEDVTRQYMEYLRAMENLDIEVDSEYLVMASELMLMKSKSLLPGSDKVEDDELEEEEVSKENLISRLVEYQKYKELAGDFRKLEIERKKIYTKAPSKISCDNKSLVKNEDISVDDLLQAFYRFLDRKNKEKPLQTKITNKEYSVKKRKNDIKAFLLHRKKAEFSELFDKWSKSYVIVTFLSILELAKEEDVMLKQEENFGDIYIELRLN